MVADCWTIDFCEELLTNVNQGTEADNDGYGISVMQTQPTAQPLASVTSEGGMKIFTARMAQMESFLHSWQTGDSDCSNSIVKSKEL